MSLIHRLPLRTLTVAAIVLAVAKGSVFSQTSNPPQNAELATAVQFLRDGESKKALNALKQAVKKNKSDGEAWYYLGIVYLQLNDFKKAASAFATAIEVRPDLAAPVHAGFGYALLLRNNLYKAVEAANIALSLDPNNIEALYTLALVALRKGAKEESVKKADALIALKPDFAAAYLLKSQAFVGYSGGVLSSALNESKDERQGNYAAAAEALEKYLQLETDHGVAEPWKEQLETLRFYMAGTAASSDVYVSRQVTTKAKVTAKPEPEYTQRARSEAVEGTVVLRCVFASDGKVKHILVVQALPYGLTERSMAAAKKIKFVPATLDGRPVSVWMQLEYNFSFTDRL